MQVNNNLYLLQETLLLKYIFNKKLSPMCCVGNQSVLTSLFAFGFVIPREAFIGKYIPGSNPYSPPPASLSCISLVPFSPPFSSQYPYVQFTIMFIAIFVCQDLCMLGSLYVRMSVCFYGGKFVCQYGVCQHVCMFIGCSVRMFVCMQKVCFPDPGFQCLLYLFQENR